MYLSIHNTLYYLLSLNLEEFWIVLCKSLFIHTKKVIFWGTFRPFFFSVETERNVSKKKWKLVLESIKSSISTMASIFKAFFKSRKCYELFHCSPLKKKKKILIANRKTMSRQPFCFCCSYAQNLRGVTFMELL